MHTVAKQTIQLLPPVTAVLADTLITAYINK